MKHLAALVGLYSCLWIITIVASITACSDLGICHEDELVYGLPIIAFTHIVIAAHRVSTSLIAKLPIIAASSYCIYIFMKIFICRLTATCDADFLFHAMLIIVVIDIVFVLISAVPATKPLHPPFGPDAQLRVKGPPPFRQAIDAIMTELHAKAPGHLEEVLLYLPKAEYDPHLGFSGQTDGTFSLNGTDYEALRFIFLHEVGHNMLGKSETRANGYARRVLNAIGASEYRKTITCRMADQK